MSADLPSLDITVSTCGAEGIHRVVEMLLPPINGVRYVVSWQNHCGAPVPGSIAGRDDVDVYRLERPGLSANRNNALDHCSADIVLIADDDLTYYPQGIAELRRAFGENSELDLATLRSDHGDMSRFPHSAVELTEKLPKNYYVTSFETAFRRATVGRLRFDERFGLGSPMLHAGEDEMFLLSALRAGYSCWFLPITICSHPHESTGTKGAFTPENLMGLGAVIRMWNPSTWPLRIALKARRVSKNGQASFGGALKWLMRGARYVSKG